MDIAIKVKDVNLKIGSREILKNINLDIPKGHFVGILGPNGAGKTTLLKCFNGINKPSGEIELNNYNKDDYSEKELAKIISLMNQNTNLDFGFTCEEIVSLGRYPYLQKGFWASVGDKEVVENVMKRTDTWSMKDKNFNTLSGGERQRVLFAKVLAQDTDIILLDEPTASMDIYFQRQLMQFGKDLAKEGKTVVMAIHDLNSAIQFCDYFCLMKQGELLAVGDFNQVFTQENLHKAYNVNTCIYKSPVTDEVQLEIIE